jgi:hypothetical protein
VYPSDNSSRMQTPINKEIGITGIFPLPFIQFQPPFSLYTIIGTEPVCFRSWYVEAF